MYLGWYDPDKKRAIAQKADDACARYRRKWGCEARVVICNPAAVSVLHVWALARGVGVDVRGAAHVPPNTFFVGEDEDAGGVAL